MAQITKDITVDVARKNLFQAIIAKQNDTNSRFLRVTLCNEGEKINVPSGASVIINAERADGTSKGFMGSVNSDGTVTVPLTSWMLALDDVVKCSISIIDADEQKLTSTSFSLDVEAAEVTDYDVTTDNENYDILVRLISDCSAVKEGCETAASSAATAAGNATTAASNANTATDRANAAAEKAESVVEQAAKIVTRYGVRFEGSANSGATVKRLYNAVGLVAGVGTDTEKPQNDFDSIYPWSARRRCCGYWDENGNFVVNAYKGEPGYTEDGSNGEVWLEHSLFYYKHDYLENGSEEIVMSATPLAGFEPAPIFKGENDTTHMKGYTPAYPMATVDGKATSRSGVFSNIYSLNSAIEAARTLGDDFTVTQTAEWYTECLYMWVEFATRNLQSVMQGACNMPYSASDTATVTENGVNRIIVTNAVAAKYVVGQTIGIGTSLGTGNVANNRIITAITDYGADNKSISFDGDPVDITAGNIVFALPWKNGSCNSVIASSGSPVSNTSGKYNCVYRGKETPYGNAFEWISDLLFKRNGEGTSESPYTYDIYFLPDVRKYNKGTITSDYVKLNFQLPAADGYVSKLGLDDRFPWVRIPCEPKAGGTTYYSDYYYFPRYAVGAARVGGDWSRGSYGGPVYWDCGIAPSFAWVVCRARLSHRR